MSRKRRSLCSRCYDEKVNGLCPGDCEKYARPAARVSSGRGVPDPGTLGRRQYDKMQRARAERQ